MTLRLPVFLYAVLLLFFASCSKKEKKVAFTPAVKDTLVRMRPFKPAPNGTTQEYIAEKHAAIDKFVNKVWRNNSDNLSFMVVKDGKILYEKYQGVADKKRNIAMAADTPLHIASVGKVLTATAILELVDAGKIELDQKVNTILTNFPYPEITVKTLLNHRSGLQNYAYFTDQSHIWDKTKVLTNQDVLDLYIEHNLALNFETDRKFTYCNTNYVMLALIIEKITGLTYPQAMQEMIFTPLGMNDTYVFEFDKHHQTAIPSYAGNREIPFDFLDGTYGDKNIYSTPRDLMKFDMARYSPNHLNPKLKKKVYVGYSYEHKGEKNYGLGIRIIEWVTGQHFYFHNGWWHGNTASYVNLRKEQVMIIALTNKYSTKPYKVRLLATLFGDYPFDLGKDDVFN